ncbi:MAG: hypothetical protein ACYC8V_05740 [Caulobacteraceae bacterium]
MTPETILAVVRPERLSPGPADTLVAVVVGAVLATVSGIAATMLENTFARRRCGATPPCSSARRLDHHGPHRHRRQGARPTRARRLRAQPRGVVDIREGRLRLDIHSLMVRLSITIDGLLDGGASEAQRDQGFQFLLGPDKEIAPVMNRLAKLRGEPFDAFMRETSRALEAPT